MCVGVYAHPQYSYAAETLIGAAARLLVSCRKTSRSSHLGDQGDGGRGGKVARRVAPGSVDPGDCQDSKDRDIMIQ